MFCFFFSGENSEPKISAFLGVCVCVWGGGGGVGGGLGGVGDLVELSRQVNGPYLEGYEEGNDS